MNEYQHQGTSLTLEEGLAEYYGRYAPSNRGASQSADANDFFFRHDVVHVLYGCDTSLGDEAVVKLASIFGTTAGLKILTAYRSREVRDIYDRLAPLDVLRTVAKSVWLVPRVIVDCRRQRRRWPWTDPEDRLKSSLRELREEFGIVVAHRPYRVNPA